MAAGVPSTAVNSLRQRPWISFVSSAALHLLLVALAVRLSHTQPVQERQEAAKSDAPRREVQMVYLDPPPRPAPPPIPPPQPPVTPPPQPVVRPQAIAPPPEKAQTTPEPEANAPPEAKRSKGREPDADKPPEKERQGQPDATPATSPLATTEATMESEAKRIFGTPKKFTPEGVGPRASRPMEAYLPDHPERCTRAESRDSSGRPQFGTVVGKILRQDNGKPLIGAHLQMLGTPYVAFTDGVGQYRFRFDLALVDNCRTQYVRVTAGGYESRLLVLVVGPNAVTQDVELRKK